MWYIPCSIHSVPYPGYYIGWTDGRVCHVDVAILKDNRRIDKLDKNLLSCLVIFRKEQNTFQEGWNKVQSDRVVPPAYSRIWIGYRFVRSSGERNWLFKGSHMRLNKCQFHDKIVKPLCEVRLQRKDLSLRGIDAGNCRQGTVLLISESIHCFIEEK